MNPRLRSFGAEALFYVSWIVALVALRASQILSELDRFYDLEFTIMGQLALSVADGTLDLSSPGALPASYQYMAFAPGTLVAQVLTLLLSVPLGANGFALLGSSVVCEVSLVVAWIYCGRSMMARRWVSLSVLPLLFAPWHAVQWQLMPFGNHSEYLVVPVVVLAVLVGTDGRRWWHWAGLGLWVALGLVLYRLTLASGVGLLAAAWTARMSRRFDAWLLLVPVSLAAVAVIALYRGSGLGFVGELQLLELSRLSPMALLHIAWDKLPQLAHPCWGTMRACEPEFAPPGWNVVYKAILLAFAPIALWIGYKRPSARIPVVFVLGWCAAAFLIPVVVQREGLDRMPSRYFLATFYGLVACGLIGLGRGGKRIRIGVAVGFVLLTVAGVDVARRHHHPQRWSTNRQIDVLALGQRLSVWRIYLDDVPYYDRTLRERAGERFVHGQSLTHVLDIDASCCPGADGALRAVPHCLRPEPGIRWHDPLWRAWHELLPAAGSTDVPPDTLPIAVFVGDAAWAQDYELSLWHGGQQVKGELQHWIDPGDGPDWVRRWVRFVPAQPLIPGGFYTWRASPGADALERLRDSDVEEASFQVGEETTAPTAYAPVVVSGAASGERFGTTDCGWDIFHRVDLRIDVEPPAAGQLHLFARTDGAPQTRRWRTAQIPPSYSTVHLTYLVSVDGDPPPPICVHAVHENAAGERSEPSEELCIPFVD